MALYIDLEILCLAISFQEIGKFGQVFVYSFFVLMTACLPMFVSNNSLEYPRAIACFLKRPEPGSLSRLGRAMKHGHQQTPRVKVINTKHFLFWKASCFLCILYLEHCDVWWPHLWSYWISSCWQVFRRYYDSPWFTMIHDDSPFIKVPKQTRSLTARVDKVLPGSSGGERTDLNSNQILRGSRSNNDGKKTTWKLRWQCILMYFTGWMSFLKGRFLVFNLDELGAYQGTGGQI